MSVQLTKVVVSGEAGRDRLRDIDCHFPSGRVTLLLGRTGSGKSTLLDVASGLISPTSGEIAVDGQPLWQGRSGKLRNRSVTEGFGYVFQQAEDQLFATTVAAEFGYSLRSRKLPKAAVTTRATTALATVDLPAAVLPRSPFTLSGGQKRRVALATTVVTEPKWWFLDEPSAGLDPAALVQLTDWVRQKKPNLTGGMVIATHDLDAFLPLADHVIILSAGQLLAETTAADLLRNPDALRRADVGLPSAAELAALLQAAGMPLQLTSFTAEAVSAAIAQAMGAGMGGAMKATMGAATGAAVAGPRQGGAGVGLACAPGAPTSVASTSVAPAPAATEAAAPAATRLAIVRGLDPRAKWVAYLELTIGFIVGTSWLGLGLSAVLSILCVTLSGVGWRRVQTLARPFAWFIVFSAVFSGIRLHASGGGMIPVRFGFDAASLLITVHRILPFLFVMSVGILLPETTSQLRLKQGLEQGLSWFKRLHLPVEALSLGTSLMLRFIPMISDQVNRFTRIARARGNKKRDRKRLAPRDFVMMAIPLVIALLKLGDELSHAMEVRGYGALGQRRTASSRLRFTRRDWLMVAAGAVVLSVYLVISMIR